MLATVDQMGAGISYGGLFGALDIIVSLNLCACQETFTPLI